MSKRLRVVHQQLVFTVHLKQISVRGCERAVMETVMERGLSVVIDALPQPWMHLHASGPIENAEVKLDANQDEALKQLRYTYQ